MNTLIVTSSILPVTEAAGVKIIDPSARLFQLCCSMVSWAGVPEINNIILCDNTQPEYNFQPLYALMKLKKKNLEVFTFAGDRKKVAEKGKGYGEGEILRYIFDHSQLIRRSRSFYKVTGRIFVRNFSKIHQQERKSLRLFDNPIPLYRRYAKQWAVRLLPSSRHGRGMVRTVFYKCDTRFFLKQLLVQYENVNDCSRFYLEHAYFYPLIRHGFATFKIKPSLVGISSSSGQLYQDGNDYSAGVKEKARQLVAVMED